MKRWVLPLIAFLTLQVTPLDAQSNANGYSWGSANPVIYDNDEVIDCYTDTYMMALASNGEINLKGIITTSSISPYNQYVTAAHYDQEASDRQNIVDAARNSGFQHIPDPVKGVKGNLVKPGNGSIDSTAPISSIGSTLIINAARAATTTTPLLIVVGGPVTTIADAYLQAPDIADKVIVLWSGATSSAASNELGGYNSWSDGWASHIVMTRMKTVIWSLTESQLPSTPKTYLATLRSCPLQQYIYAEHHPTNPLPGDFDGDSPPAIAIMRGDYTTVFTNVADSSLGQSSAHEVPTISSSSSGPARITRAGSGSVATTEWHRAVEKALAVGGPTATPSPPASHVSTANSASFADVSAAVARASRNDTVNIPAGTANWGSNTLLLTRGIQLLGAGRDSVFITTSNCAITITPDSTAITNEEMIRVEGITFDGNNVGGGATGTGGIITVNGAGSTSTKPFKNLAIGWSRFKNTSTNNATGIYCRAQVRGAIYDNDFDRADEPLRTFGNDDVTEWNNGHFPQSYGTSDNLYFESNTIRFSSAYNASAPGWIESGQGARYVVRYNNYDFTNAITNGFATVDEWLDMHGFQNWTSGTGDNGQTGTMVTEVYGNTVLNWPGNRTVALRGGWSLIHNNIITGTGAGQMQVWDADYSTAAWVDGLNSGIDTRVNNTYVFNNTKNGTENPIVRNLPTGTQGTPPTLENAQFYNFNASFNGSTGIGRGTSAPSMSATNGTAYWQNATATVSTDPNVVQAGTLWKRVGGAWTAYYRPFTFPHPLATGAATIPAASAAEVDVQAAIAQVSNGGTVAVPAGTATWSTTIDLGTKAISLIGAGSGGTIINNTAGKLIKSSHTGNNLVRISGFRFNSSDGMTPITNFTGPAFKVRVDHCFFNKGDCAIGTNFAPFMPAGDGPVYGVADHNTFLNMQRPLYRTDARTGDQAAGGPQPPVTSGTTSNTEGAVAWTEPFQFGTGNMFFAEDNVFDWDANNTEPNAQGAVYGTYGGNVCFRYNTVHGATFDAHGDYPGHSTKSYEVYRNIFNQNPRLDFGNTMFLRGGQHMVHDNTFNYSYNWPIHLTVYWEYDSTPDRIKNSYFWNNKVNANTDPNFMVAVVDSGQTSAGYAAQNLHLNQQYFFRQPQSGDIYYPYTEYTYPHPLVSGTSAPPVETSQSPIVSLTAPAPDAIIATDQSPILLTADASDPDGTVTKVEFFEGGNKLGEATTAPYSYSWSRNIAGNYALTAKATDNSGNVSTSSVVNFHILPIQNGPSFASTTGGVIFPPFVINSDGTISQPKETVVPSDGGQAVYCFNIATAGEYVFSVQANFPDGGSNSVFWNVDSKPTASQIFSCTATTVGLQTLPVTVGCNTPQKKYNLTAGKHFLYISGRETGAKIGAITFSSVAPPIVPLPDVPTGLIPSDGTTGVDTRPVLQWNQALNAQSYNVKFGQDNPPTVTHAIPTGTSYNPGLLDYSTNYYYQVSSVNSAGSTDSPVITFTTLPPPPTPTPIPTPAATPTPTPPSTPANPAPTDTSTGVTIAPTLTWTASYATTYDIYFGSFASHPLVATGLTSPSWKPATLTNNTIYYWQVVAKNSVDINGTPTTLSTMGPLWRFTTQVTNPLTLGSSTDPVNNQTNVPVTHKLIWSASGDVKSDIFFGTSNNPPLLRANFPTYQTYDLSDYGPLAYSTSYYWKIRAYNAAGSSLTGPVLKFTTAAPPSGVGPPTNPLPSDAATDIAINGTLRWQAAGDNYDIFLDQNNPPVTQVATAMTGLSYTTPSLMHSKTYYWKVRSHSAGSSYDSPVWSFTTTQGDQTPQIISVTQ